MANHSRRRGPCYDTLRSVLAPASPAPKIRRAMTVTANWHTAMCAVRCGAPALALVVAGAAFGAVFPSIPPVLASILAGLIWAGAGALIWHQASRFHPMSLQEAARLMEVRAGLADLAPLTGAQDRVAYGSGALWAWHQHSLIEAQSRLAGPAFPRLSHKDLAVLAALVLGLAIAFSRPAGAARALWFDVSPLAGDGVLAIEVWAEPPAYTGQPTVRLDLQTSKVRLVKGSLIFARVDGARGAPRLSVPGGDQRMSRGRAGAWTASLPVSRSGTIALHRFGKRAVWHLEIVPDKPPSLELDGPITIDSRGRLTVSYRASDDFAIKSTALAIAPVDMPIGLEGHPIPEIAVPADGNLSESGASEGTRKVFINGHQHVLAGLQADVRLLVRDDLGQTTLSEPTRLIMPERSWTTTLAAALAEQRLLILREARPWRWTAPSWAKLYDPGADKDVRLDLSEPIVSAPPGIMKAHDLMLATVSALKFVGLPDTAILGLSLAQAQLEAARDPQTAHQIAPLLWQMAQSIDAQGQTPAQARMEQARQALEDALRNGASDQEIRALTQEFKEAVRERVQELAEQGESQGGAGQMQSQGGTEITGDDLDSMLEDLERNGTGGARGEALAQLDQLDQLMNNLQASPDGSGQGSGGAAGTQLDEAMRAQRDLSDETAQRNGQEDPQSADDLAARQDALADQVSPPGQSPQGQSPQGQSPQGQSPQGQSGQTGQDPAGGGQEQAARQQAGQAMREAADALRAGDLEQAQAAQTRAEEALQQAAQARQSGQGSANGEDPLGRPSRRPDDGRATKVPPEGEKRRARDVREELRKRQADPRREKIERDYIDRLLQDSP
jgi:Domain of unknown function (DUF4175)